MAGLPQPMPRRGESPLASDEDRERAAGSLRRHYAAGRLDAQELERRLSVAVAARTKGELAVLFRDLPSDRARRLARLNRRLLRAHAAGYLAGNGALIGIWDLTGGGEFWPAWTLVPTTAVLVWHVGATWVARQMAADRRRKRYRI